MIPKETTDIQNVFKSFSFGNEDLWTLGLIVSHNPSNNYFLLLETIYLSQGTQDTLPSRLMVYLKFLEILFNTMPFSSNSHPLLGPRASKPMVGSKFICPLCISLKFLGKPGNTGSTSFNAPPGILTSHLFSPSWFPGRDAGNKVTVLRYECSFCSSSRTSGTGSTMWLGHSRDSFSSAKQGGYQVCADNWKASGDTDHNQQYCPQQQFALFPLPRTVTRSPGSPPHGCTNKAALLG